jgi:hypothetical protein
MTIEYLNKFNKSNLIFVHIPKTGGTNICSMFGISTKDTMYNMDWEQTPWSPMPKHIEEVDGESGETLLKPILIRNHKTAAQRKYLITGKKSNAINELDSINKTFAKREDIRFNGYAPTDNTDSVWENSASMIRNPYDRVVSLYYWAKAFWKYKEGLDLPGYPKFETWIEDNFGIADRISQEDLHELFKRVRYQSETLGNDNSKWYTSDIIKELGPLPNFRMPCFYWVTDNTDSIIVNDIVKLEDASPEMRNSDNENAWKPVKKHYSYLYNKRTYDLITKYYRIDLDTFNYTFENNANIKTKQNKTNKTWI